MNSSKARRSKVSIQNVEYSYSDNEDDPEPYQSSGEEWSQGEAPPPVQQKKRITRRSLARANKKVKTNNSSSSEIETDNDSKVIKIKPKYKKSEGKRKVKGENFGKKIDPITVTCKTYATGSFLILKKDAQVGDPNKHPCIWRIDGKALLQKYEPFEDVADGKIRHKTTSVYTGWSALDRDLYAPLTIKICQQANQSMIVEMDWGKLKEIIIDSD